MRTGIRIRLEHWEPLAPALCSAILAALVAAPWIVPGFIFGVDFPGYRRIPFPDSLASWAPLQLAFAAIGAILSAQITAKLLIACTFFAAAFAAYRALPVGGFIPRAVASAVYLVNPYPYGRLQYGQLFVLAGYALLPWVALSVRQLLQHPRPKTSIVTAASFVLLSAFDIHLLIPAAILTLLAVAVELVTERQNRPHLVGIARSLTLTAGLSLVGILYWLIPLLAGSGVEAGVIGRTTQADLYAYSAVGDPRFGLLPNLLGLYGFWAENVGRFLPMKAFVPLWPVALAALLILLAIGIDSAFRSGSDARFPGARRWVTGLVLAGLVAIVLEMGFSDSHTAPIVRWLDSIFPPYRGMRDAGKWGALVALVYAQLIPLGVIAVLAWLRRHLPAGGGRELGLALATGLSLALPLYYGNGLLFGLHGQIQSSQYPAGWYAADRLLIADPHPGRALFLPWHGYLRLSFVQNTDSVIATPAPTFFSVPIVASQDPEIPGVLLPNSPDQVAIHQLVSDGGQGSWAATLAGRGIKYVLLAKEVNWQQYGYLDQQQGLTRVADFGTIVVYRNTMVP